MFGRARGAILFADDPHLSPHHGTLLLKDDRLVIRDEGSLSGIFIAVARETLSTGSSFAAGSRLFRYQGAVPAPEQPSPGKPLAYGAPVPDGQILFTIEEILVGGRPGRVLATPGPVVSIGRQQCDLSFPGDESLALRHCELAPSDRQAVLKDLSGAAGTWIRIPSGIERPLAPGDRFRVGLQTLQVTALS
jgi:pSer/pThr/pTyr-binding forkhead associated (FHA) protein